MRKFSGYLLLILMCLGLVMILLLRWRAVLYGKTDDMTLPGSVVETQLEETGADLAEVPVRPDVETQPNVASPGVTADLISQLRPVSLSEADLPEELLQPAEHRGTVEEDDYPTRDMVSDVPDRINKDVMVYLPYGYDPQQQYDVLILLHCAWADHRFWLGQDRNYGTEDNPVMVSVPNLLDRMIEEEYCKPLIVVSPCIYLYDHQPSNAGNGYDYAQFALEFGKDFLPWVVETYATYAVDGSREALRDARDHFAVLGASFGAYTAYISLIGDNFDLLSWYTFCGGGEIDPNYLMNSWAQRGTDRMPLDLLYICEGEYDDRAGPEGSYYNLINAAGPFGENNVKFTLVHGWGHEDHSYLIGLFNSLQMFFRE